MKFFKVISRQLRERRTVIGIIVLALLVAFTGWRRLTSTDPDEAAALPPGAVPGTDYALTDFTLTLLDTGGNLNLSLTGSAMRHDPRRQRSEIDDPQARIPRLPDVVWQATSRSGWVTDDAETVRLVDDVRLLRASPSISELRLVTEALFLYPERRLARTDARVLIEQPGARVQGKGLRIDLDAGHYQINEQVTGRYEMPEKRHDTE